MNLLLAALSVLAVIPHDDVLRDEVDLVEHNWFYDENGRLVFDQIIFYNWHENIVIPPQTTQQIDHCQNPVVCGPADTTPGFKGSRFQVVAWRLVKRNSEDQSCTQQGLLPERDWKHGGYSCKWYDGETLRFVHAKSVRETWTQYDPELIERNFLEKEKRRELKKVPPKKTYSPPKDPFIPPTDDGCT